MSAVHDVPTSLPPVQRAVADDAERGHLDNIAPGDVARDGVRHLARLIRLRPLAVAIAIVGSIAFVAGVLVTSLVIGGLTDDLLIPVLGQGEPRGPRLTDAVLAVLGVGVWRAVGITVRRTSASWAQVTVLADIRRRLVEHQLGLSLRWYATQRVGDLLAVNDAHVKLATQVLGPLPFAVGAVLLTTGSMALVLSLDVLLGVTVVAILLLAVTGELVAAWATFSAFDLEQHRKSVVSRVAHESIDGAQTVAALGARDHEVRRFAAVVARSRDAEVLVGKRWSWFRATMEVLPSLIIVPVIVVGALRVSAGALSVGDLVTASYLLSLLTIPLAIIGFLVWDTAHSLTGWRRLAAVLDADDRMPSGVDETGGTDPAAVAASGVGFAYVQDEPAVLHGLDLQLHPGTTVGLVGATGSGKSTLISLLARLWDPGEGDIRIDGRDLRGMQDDARTSQVALVGQDAFVFDDTVRGNVLLGHEATDDEVWAALAIAEADGFVRALPDGLDHLLGERGTSLSGGQRQRVALARALVRRPRLLLLDDATSALDPSVEASILRRLRDADAPSTVLLVATRPASVALCDQIVLLGAGTVQATGTHAELLRTEPAYARLLQAYERERAARGTGGQR